MARAVHLREQSALLCHYVDNRTLVALCGRSTLDWRLVLDNRAVTCEKCKSEFEKENTE